MISLNLQAGRRTTCLFAAVASFASWLFLSTRFRLFLVILLYLYIMIYYDDILMQLEIISGIFTISYAT